MPQGDIALITWSYGLMGAAYSAFSVHLVMLGYARAPRNVASLALLGASVLSALLAWLTLADAFSNLITFRILGSVVDVLRYACWSTFLLGLLAPPQAERTPRLTPWLKAVAAATIGVALVLRPLPGLDFNLSSNGSRMVMLSAMSLPLLGMILVEQLFRDLQEDSKWNMKPLCLGLAGTFLFEIYMYSQGVLFGAIDEDASSIRGAVCTLMVPLLLLSINRQREWVARLRVSRQAAFHSVTLLAAGAYLIFMSGVGYYVRYFGGEWGRALQLGLIFPALIALGVLALSGTVRAKLRVLLGKHFFRYRYDYREEWLRFTHTLSTPESPNEMGQQVIRGLADMLESPGGSLWTKSPDGKTYVNSARWNSVHQSIEERVDSAFSQFLSRSGWVINLEEYRSRSNHYEGLVLPDWLATTPDAWLIVPLRVGDELTAFVLLASARTTMDVNWEVTDLLKTAGRQAASVLAQMQATEALLEVRKFDAFNRMSAFVVHDLKNIVTQLSLMMKNAKRLHANPEFQQDMLMTVENSLDRMRQLMLQLREGATPAGTAFGVDLPALVERIAGMAGTRGRTLDVEVVDRITTRGHEDRLERILGHVVQNAFDATDRDGRVWVRLDRNGSQARIEIGDTGHGMSAEFIRDRLFKPFQTTKQAGMGIGAYESFQYVQELGGTIQVRSQPNQGTRVVVLLPLFDARNEPDLQMSRAS